MMNKINVNFRKSLCFQYANSLGKGEAESTILSRSTSFSLTILHVARAPTLWASEGPCEAKSCGGRHRAPKTPRTACGLQPITPMRRPEDRRPTVRFWNQFHSPQLPVPICSGSPLRWLHDY